MIDGGCILVTIAISIYLNHSGHTGMDALADLGKFAVCLMALGVELLLFIILTIIHLVKKHRSKKPKD